MDSQIRHTLRITTVDERRARQHFQRLAPSFYRDDPNWVSPLLIERREHLSKKNPYFEHAHWRAFIAWRNGLPVGRISAQVDQLHLERYHDATGFFGFLDAEDSAETFNALLETAERWLIEQGLVRIRGPFSFSINQETGLLVEGFDTPPMVMMGHARPYYSEHIEGAGYHKARDMLAYRVRPDFEPPAAMTKLVASAGARLQIRPMQRGRLDEELEVLRSIFNDAWSDNWGFVPFTKAEFKEMGTSLKMLIDDDFVQIAEVDGQPAAFIVAMPNLNEAIQDLDGRLLPMGWLKLLWRLKVKYPTTGRVPLMGVRRRFQKTRLGTALAFSVIDTVRKPMIRRGIRDVELSWILEENKGMRAIIELIGGVAYKTYRVYEKNLI